MNTDFFEDDVPYITGAFTDWKPAPMFDAITFCEITDPAYETPYEKAISLGMLRQGATHQDFARLSMQDKNEIDRQMRSQRDDYEEGWQSAIRSSCPYKRPMVFNAEHREMLDDFQKTYVYSMYLPCGKQHFIISNKLDGVVSHYLTSKIVGHRDEPVPVHSRAPAKRAHKKVEFKKSETVFRTWEDDTDKKIIECMDHDAKYWKVNRLIKDKNEYVAVLTVVQEHYEFLKNTHIEVASTSEFPHIYAADFTVFMQRANLIDRTFTQADIDRVFAATNEELVDQANNDDEGLSRYEFIEVLIRLAYEKYYRKGERKTQAEAFRLLVERNLRIASREWVWGRFRITHLYTTSVTDLLASNLDIIATIYQMLLDGELGAEAAEPEDSDESATEPPSPDRRTSLVSRGVAKGMLEEVKQE